MKSQTNGSILSPLFPWTLPQKLRAIHLGTLWQSFDPCSQACMSFKLVNKQTFISWKALAIVWGNNTYSLTSYDGSFRFNIVLHLVYISCMSKYYSLMEIRLDDKATSTKPLTHPSLDDTYLSHTSNAHFCIKHLSSSDIARRISRVLL